MKKVLLVLLTIVAMAGATVEAKSVSKTPVGCWSYMDESEPDTAIANGEVQDTLVVIYRADYDSLVLCRKGVGFLEYRITKRFVATTEDGYEKVFEFVDEYRIQFGWKYENDMVQILSCLPDVSCTHVERTSDNRGTKYPSHFNNSFDEEAAEYMIDLLPRLQFYYDSHNGNLYSRGYKAFFEFCEGKPTIYSTKETII